MHMPLCLAALLKKQSQIIISGAQFDTKRTVETTAHEHPCQANPLDRVNKLTDKR